MDPTSQIKAASSRSDTAVTPLAADASKHAARIASITAAFALNPKCTHKQMKAVVGPIANGLLNSLMKEVRGGWSAETGIERASAAPELVTTPSTIAKAIASLNGAIVAEIRQVRREEHDAYFARHEQERQIATAELDAIREELSLASNSACELAQECDEHEESLRYARETMLRLEGLILDHVGLLKQSQSQLAEMTRELTAVGCENQRLRASILKEAKRAEDAERAAGVARDHSRSSEHMLQRALKTVEELGAELVSCGARCAAAEDALRKTTAALTAHLAAAVIAEPKTGTETAPRLRERARARATKAS